MKAPILWPPDVKNWFIWKYPDAGKDWRLEGTTEDEMVGWHHWLNGYEFEQTPGVSDGHGGLACYSPWGCRVWCDWATEVNWILERIIRMREIEHEWYHVITWAKVLTETKLEFQKESRVIGTKAKFEETINKHFFKACTHIYFLLGHLYICVIVSLPSQFFNIFFSFVKALYFIIINFRISSEVNSKTLISLYILL